MPKSKREKTVALTRTKKKGRALKEKLLTNVREAVNQYKRIFVFEVENMRNVAFKALRDQWGGSRFFLGKNAVMQAALGRSADTEVAENLHKLAERIEGNCGLLFTDSSQKDVENFFSSFREVHFARSGFQAVAEFSLTAGPLPAEEFPHPIEPQLRKLGLPSRLVNGIIELTADCSVCQVGDILTPEQCKILELFNQPQAEMKVHLLASWAKGKYSHIADRIVSDVLEINLDSDDGEDAGAFKEEFLPVPDLSSPEAIQKSMEIFLPKPTAADNKKKEKKSTQNAPMELEEKVSGKITKKSASSKKGKK